MTPDERDIITRFIARVAGQPAAGSVPASATPLPPVDAEADGLIGDLFARYPEARYRLTQMAFVQEHALAEGENRRRQLEWELAQARQAAAQAPPAPAPAGGGFFGGLFGTRAAAPAPAYPQGGYPPPQPSYAPGYQPGMFQRSGSGFLGSALTTAAGVAGGMVLGNALMGMFSPGPGAGIGQGLGAGGPFGGASPWSDPGGAGGAPFDQDQDKDSGPADAGGGFDQSPDSDDSFTQGGDPGGSDDSWV